MKKIIYLTFLVTAVSFSQNKFKDQPLVSEIFTADPQHIFSTVKYMFTHLMI